MTSLVVIPMVGVATVCLVIALAWPFLTVVPPSSAAAADNEDARRQVDDDLRRSLEAIREIEFDRASGHLNDDDFAALDADERARAVALMRQRDLFDGATREST